MALQSVCLLLRRTFHFNKDTVVFLVLARLLLSQAAPFYRCDRKVVVASLRLARVIRLKWTDGMVVLDDGPAGENVISLFNLRAF